MCSLIERDVTALCSQYLCADLVKLAWRKKIFSSVMFFVTDKEY